MSNACGLRPIKHFHSPWDLDLLTHTKAILYFVEAFVVAASMVVPANDNGVVGYILFE